MGVHNALGPSITILGPKAYNVYLAGNIPITIMKMNVCFL